MTTGVMLVTLSWSLQYISDIQQAINQAQEQTLEYYNRAKQIEARCKDALTTVSRLRTQNASLKQFIQKVLDQNQKLRRDMEQSEAEKSTLEKEIYKAKETGIQAVLSAWNKANRMDVALELRYGLGYTWSQYNGLRYATAFKYSSGRYRRQRFGHTCHRIPCLPTEKMVLDYARGIAASYGIAQVPQGSKVDICKAVTDALESNDNWVDEERFHHLQFCAGAMRVFRSGTMTNFGVRAFSETKFYNALTSMCVIGIGHG